MKRVVVIGAGGEMMGMTVRALGRIEGIELVLADRDAAALARVAQQAGSRATTATVDLFDRESLGALVRGADLVVNGAGPFAKTAETVVRACIAERVDYLDIADDIEAVTTVQAAEADVRAAGINVLLGCGVSPGLTNVMARGLIDLLDPAEPIDVDVAWLVGDEGEQRMGAAVLEHAIHMVSGTCLTWADGAPATIPAFELAADIPYTAQIGTRRQWQLAHPEVVTLPHHLPHLRSVRCFGGLLPEATNGVLRGLGRAVDRGELTLGEAATFLGSVLAGGNGTLKGWKAARAGLRDQVGRGELTSAQRRQFYWDGVRKRHEPFVGGFFARVTGSRDGHPVTITRRSGASGAGTGIPSMAHITGHAAAAFALRALDQRPAGGVLNPEAWITLDELAPALLAVGLPADVIEPVSETPMLATR